MAKGWQNHFFQAEDLARRLSSQRRLDPLTAPKLNVQSPFDLITYVKAIAPTISLSPSP
jgi:hypothetical protein